MTLTEAEVIIADLQSKVDARDEAQRVLTDRIEEMQQEINGYREWDAARSMVIKYMFKHKHIERATDWAYKVINLMEEREAMLCGRM